MYRINNVRSPNLFIVEITNESIHTSGGGETQISNDKVMSAFLMLVELYHFDNNFLFLKKKQNILYIFLCVL